MHAPPTLCVGITLLVAALLVGCGYSDASNPTLIITRAEVVGDQAELDLKIKNPTNKNVQVKAVQWSLLYGPLPVADGAWQLDATVPSSGSHQFSRQVAFAGPALDPDATEVELSGTLDIAAAGEMLPEETAFVATQTTTR